MAYKYKVGNKFKTIKSYDQFVPEAIKLKRIYKQVRN